MINTLKYSQELQKAGFSREQAEASVNFLIEVMDQNLAAKTDLTELRLEIHSDFKELKLATQSELRELRQDMDSKFARFDSRFQELEYKLTIKLGAMLTVAVGVTAALHKIL